MQTTTEKVLSTALSPYTKFIMALKSKEVQRQYPNLLGRFLDFCRFEGLTVEEKSLKFYQFAKASAPDVLEDLVIKFVISQKDRIDEREITAGTLRNYVKAIKLFSRMNRITMNWDLISSSLPKVKQYGNDRIPTQEEIKKLVEYPDRRIKLIVFVSLSTGIRVGAWDYMKWKHVTPIKNENGEILAAKLTVYPNEPEEYFTFMTVEAYNAIKDLMDFRASFGEEITVESWIMRNTWQKVKPRYSHRIGLAKFPKQFKSMGVKTLVGRALQIQGVRPKLDPRMGNKNHDWKTMHGFRKYFKTQTERVMKSLNVEILMGHDIGLANSYYKPSERELLEDYLKAIDLLTVSQENRLARKFEETLVRNKALEMEKHEIEMLRKELQPLLALKNTLMKEGVLKEY